MATNLFDMNALARNRARVRALANPALFLQELVADRVSERLSEVNRSFTNPTIITSFPEIWKNHVPGATYVADNDVLDLKPDSHDLIIHAMSLHWSNDPVGQIIQCRRALQPDGLFIGVALGGQTLNELRSALAEAEIQLTGGITPRVAPMAELREFGSLLMRAGLALPVADSETVPVTYANFLDLCKDLRGMGEGNAISARQKTFTPRNLLDAAAQVYSQHFASSDGRLKATFELIYLTGWAPHQDQQKPLLPGSAKARLADALKTVEIETGENTGPSRKPADQ